MKKNKPNPELLKAFRDLQAIPAESFTEAGAHAQRCVRACEGLGDDPERAVQELVDFVRKVAASGNYFYLDHKMDRGARALLERHGLLRACDDPEQLPDAWKPQDGAGNEEHWLDLSQEDMELALRRVCGCDPVRRFCRRALRPQL